MSGELISVVIPTYNYGRFVTQAVESVLAQTYRNVEVLVVDDGSTDDTRERLRPYLDRIRYLYQANQGLSAARNTGIRAAGGELIALLDSDDLWHPRKLEIQMDHLGKHPEIGLLATEVVPDLHEGWPAVPDLAQAQAPRLTLEELVIRPRFGPSSVLVRKKCFEAAGYFDCGLRAVEDRDMWIRIGCHFPVVRLEVPLWWYRVHGGNMSLAAVRMEENELKVMRQVFRLGPLRRRYLFRQKAFSYSWQTSAYMFGAAGLGRKALSRLLWSFLLWPFPYRRQEVSTPFERPKMLVVLLLRMLRLMAPEQPPKFSREPLASAGPALARGSRLNEGLPKEAAAACQ